MNPRLAWRQRSRAPQLWRTLATQVPRQCPTTALVLQVPTFQPCIEQVRNLITEIEATPVMLVSGPIAQQQRRVCKCCAALLGSASSVVAEQLPPL